MEKYTRKDLSDDLAGDKPKLLKIEIDEILKFSQDHIIDALKKGEKVVFSNFGTFEIRKRAERKGRNPSTGEEIMIPAKDVVVFKMSKNCLE